MFRVQRAPETILELGSGTGLLTRLLRQAFPFALIHALDISEKMLEVARSELNDDRNIEWLCCDARYFTSLSRYDLIVSASAIHWMSPLAELFGNLQKLLAKGGVFLFSLMTSGTLAELRTVRERVAPDKMPVGKIPSFQTVCDALVAKGLDIASCRQVSYKEYYRNAQAFVDSLRNLGVNSGEFSRSVKPLSKNEVVDIIELYQQMYIEKDGTVGASFEVGYFEAYLKTKAPNK